jgi:hypothetical protein
LLTPVERHHFDFFPWERAPDTDVRGQQRRLSK